MSCFINGYAECHLCRVLHLIPCYAECHYAKFHYAECHYAECHYVECHYAECCYAECYGALNECYFFLFN